MANKKATSSAKQSAKPASHAETTVTTVKATPARKRGLRLNFRQAPLMAALIAEFVGTFLLAGVILASQGQPVAVLFAFAGIIFMVGAVSGAHLNPAVTIATLIMRRVTALRAVGYIVMQLLGAMTALLVLSMFVNAAGSASQPEMLGSAPQLFKANPVPAGKEGLVLAAEVIGSLILGVAVAAAMRTYGKDRVGAALGAGTGIFIALIVAGSAASVVQGSAILNPAVAMAAQAIPFGDSGKLLWGLEIYLLGSTVGIILGFVLYEFLRAQQPKNEE